MDKVCCIIQARSSSTRLPEKCFLLFNHKDITRQIYDECFCSKFIKGKVYVAVPFDDPKIIRHLARYRINLFTGSEADVLDRFYQCAKLIQPDHVVRITGDCPLITANAIDAVVEAHLESGADYTANRLEEPMYPDGFDVEVFKYQCLEVAAIDSINSDDKEHVTPYIKRNYKCHAVHCPPELLPWKDVKLSVDTQEDYERILKWYEENKCLI